ncbi:hypothetical protein Syun_016514 [Stephania yunnanensis]|uniref:Uncharacterized protein n=1 Tax=Stephania yunnanensis TaxID=152371 RepID=A0AAP0P1K0_9MAGN
MVTSGQTELVCPDLEGLRSPTKSREKRKREQEKGKKKKEEERLGVNGDVQLPDPPKCKEKERVSLRAPHLFMKALG